jgi:hypothetical protein
VSDDLRDDIVACPRGRPRDRVPGSARDARHLDCSQDPTPAAARPPVASVVWFLLMTAMWALFAVLVTTGRA